MQTLFIDPGRLRNELALEHCVPVPDMIGGYAETWVEIASVFAMIEPISAKSEFAGQPLETVTHRITIRHRSNIASGMRLRRQDRVFAVVTIHDPDDSGRYLVCLAREVGA